MDEHPRRVSDGRDGGSETSRSRPFIEPLLDWSDGDIRAYRDQKLVESDEKDTQKDFNSGEAT